MPGTEIRSLTGVRGLASLYIALYHYLLFFPADFERYPVRLFVMHGYLSVDLFFMLSAFVLSLSNNFACTIDGASYRKFMLKRWIRIYPSYFIIVLTGYLLVYPFTARLANLTLSLTLLNLPFDTDPLFLHLWSLAAEWIPISCFRFYC